MPDDGETVSTPVTVTVETDSGTVVVGFPSDTSTGVVVVPVINVIGDGQESDGGMGDGD